MRSIRPARAILGDDLFQEFARELAARDLSPITARGYLVVRKYSVLRGIKHLERWPLTCYVSASSGPRNVS
jgi:hypothetical protein